MFEIDKTENTIWFYDAVGEDAFGGISASAMKDGFDQLGAESDIVIRVNSPGGDLHDALAIHNLIAGRQGKTTVMVDGLAASAASYFPMAADEIVMAENALMMIHAPWTVTAGNAGDFRKMAETLDTHSRAMSSAYSNKTGKTPDEMQLIFNAEVWYTAAEAKTDGFIDSVLLGSEVSIITSIDPEAFHFQHVPPAARFVRLKNSANKFASEISHKERKRLNGLRAKVRLSQI